MNDLTVRNYHGDDIDGLAAFFRTYLRAFPDAKLISPEFYSYHPALENGKNVFCVADHEARLLGFAPLFPAPATDDSLPEDPHHIWTIVVADPTHAHAGDIRARLLDRVLERAAAIKASFTPRLVRLAADYMSSQKPDVDFLLEKGFEHFESVYVMRRGVWAPIPSDSETSLPGGISIKYWKMPTEAEQQAYVHAFNRCFPEMPKTFEALQFFLRSPIWGSGTAVSAFDQDDRLIGSVLVYYDENRGCGITDDVFVLPEWRRRGIGKCLVDAGLRLLQSQGVKQACLEVKRSNLPAVSLYGSAGYGIVNEEMLLGKYI